MGHFRQGRGQKRWQKLNPRSSLKMGKTYQIVMIRHGESQWNQENRFCGWFDAGLSAQGIKEAHAGGKALKDAGFKFDVAHTSVLQRAQTTLKTVLGEIGQPDLPVQKNWRLNERHYGGLTGLNKAETAEKHGEAQVKIWRRSFDVPPPPMEEGHPYHQNITKDPRYKDDPSEEELPKNESLKLTIARTLPYWDNVIGSGYVFGNDQPIIFHLLDIRPMMGVLEGVVMEMQDCALPLVKDAIATDDASFAFNDIDAAFLVGAMPRRDGMERKDLLAANVKIFKVQGQALEKFAKKSVRVLIVGNPANTNALICSHYAPSIPKENFSAMTRLDQNRAAAQLALKAGCKVQDVKKMTIWGNHSSTQFPDAEQAEICGQPAVSVINDSAWLQNQFIPIVQKRGGAVIAARKLSSAMSAAKAACDHMKSWFQGNPSGDWVSMGVFSDGSYATPAGVMFSFPVTIQGGHWSIVQGLAMSEFAKAKLVETGAELCEERDEALAVCRA